MEGYINGILPTMQHENEAFGKDLETESNILETNKQTKNLSKSNENIVESL